VAYATERNLIMKLHAQEFVRLCAVAETKDKSGKYPLQQFSAHMNSFNKTIDSRDIDDTLWGITNALLGEYKEDQRYKSRSCCEVTKEIKPDENGRLCFDIGNHDRLAVRNIVNKINLAGVERCRFFVLINAQRTEYRWVVAVSEDMVYYSD
jgi:hypothetical protein